jgi:hypothetical protein
MGRMSRRTVAWIAWSFCALSLTLTSLSLLLLALNLTLSVAHLYDYWLENTLLDHWRYYRYPRSCQSPGLAPLWSSLDHCSGVL